MRVVSTVAALSRSRLLNAVLLSSLAMAMLSCRSVWAPYPETLDFHEVFVGETSPPQKAMWEAPLGQFPAVDGVATAAPFDIVAPIPFPPDPGWPPLGHPKRTPEVTFVFKPTDAGMFTGEAMPQTATGPVAAQPLKLVGRGIRRVSAASPYLQGLTVDFGDIVVGTTSSRTLTLTNPNDHERGLEIRFHHATRPFSAAATATATKPLPALKLGAGQSTTIVLQFTPAAVGPATDIVELIDQKSGGVHVQITLTGRAHAPVG